MSSEIGLTLDERIRRSLEPLGGPLRIDSFLAVMAKERARVAAARAHASRPAQSRGARVAAAPETGASSPKEEAAAPQAEGPELADSRKLKAEVDAFLHRDERHDATDTEVSDYVDFMGPQGFNPDDLPG